MPAKKLRVEVFDAEGNRYIVSCEGNVSRERILHLLDLVELLGGTTVNDSKWRRTSYDYSKFDKICSLVKQNFPVGWFSSKDAQRVCEQEFNGSLSLSTVSTYLARMADRGFLIRKGTSNNRRYKIVTMPYNNEANVANNNK
jgi:DNA-binding transcriptional ArsR family regulator